MGMCSEWHYTTREIGGWRHDNEPVVSGITFFNTINMCDRGRTITHMQIPRFHTQVWYNYRSHVSIRQSQSCVMPFWTHAKCLLAFISYLPMWIKAKYTFIKSFIARDFMEGHICRQNTLMFALVFCFELRARAARTCCHCHLQAAVKNPIHDGKRGQLKLPKKSWTVPQCGHVTLNCVQMASKQQNVEFSSHIFQFTRLHGVAVIQGLTFRDSVVTLFKSTRWYVLSGTGFLVAHQLYIGNVMRKYKIGKSSPHQPCENTCHSNVLELSLFWMARALACF